ncbi:antibiotic biosynthesis monooxygenase family protein [Jiulongibacter sediminis]|uniref:Antibiotic biosynthesis monooxygenase n=1 Tax=Jiulongibacter sediminis TaxID=1605367 RepID=A0A0P7BW69_9BACT|nr:antibiotic biosynthesis monooxygenase [Jiulongibacter sediminis]KPM48920.1 antibiotic biosynthesis monooxygenase [Jiulongibacter sediminis]TBX25449.1 antibiotic biosynthesis monooxygenase [Jiulongibacter sediminis]
MILEFAKLSILEDKMESFLAAIPKAKAVISQSKGFIAINFKRSVENPNTVVALIEWETLEDHTIGFRESDLFPQWRAVISPFFSAAPEVEHFSIV